MREKVIVVTDKLNILKESGGRIIFQTIMDVNDEVFNRPGQGLYAWMFRSVYLAMMEGYGDSKPKFGQYGTYAKNGNAYWKGYYKHFYDDRTPLYSYYEYDKAGKYKVIKERSSNEAEFLLAKEYILLDIKLPFDLTKKYVDISLKPDDIQNVAEMKKIQSLIEQNHTGFIELKKLFDKGLITPNEFLSRKDELLN